MTASKKKKEKAKDFAKANFKLGKGKLKSANATDTSFSSRSIALSQQSITRDNAGAPTTKRNLTLEDLQVQLKHYSASTRKDALSGLRELLSAHPHLAESSVGALVPLLARMIGDEEQSVRKALLAYLSWYLPSLSPIVLQPHHSVLLFFATSAMSHIYPEIRMDAVRALDIMLETFPESIALRWNGGPSSNTTQSADDLPTKVLECYLSLLHIRSGATTNGLQTDMSPTAKALVFSSLATFIRLSTAPEGPVAGSPHQEQALPEVPTWFMAQAFPTQRAYASFVEQVLPKPHGKGRSLDMPQDHGSFVASADVLHRERQSALANISDIFVDVSSLGLPNDSVHGLPSSPEQLLRTLLPILISAFLDSGPTAFSPEAAAVPSTSTALDSATNTIIAVAQITRDLWRSVLLRSLHSLGSVQSAEILSGLEKLVGHMAVYFPFGNDELHKRSSSDSSRLQNLNITFCELVALVGLGSQGQHATEDRPVKEKVRASRNKVDNAKIAMSKYVRSLLAGSQSNSILSTSITLSPQMYAQLLPTIWSLLWTSDESLEEHDILDTVVQHFLALSMTSGVKKLAFKFLMRLLMLPSVCPQAKALPCGQKLQGLLKSSLHSDFVTALPRYLWEMGTKDESMSFLILLYMRHVLVVASIPEATRGTLSTYLAPYFMSQHPKKGSLPGPWMKLKNERVAAVALETVWWLQHDEHQKDESTSLTVAVDAAIGHCSSTWLPTCRALVA